MLHGLPWSVTECKLFFPINQCLCKGPRSSGRAELLSYWIWHNQNGHFTRKRMHNGNWTFSDEIIPFVTIGCSSRQGLQWREQQLLKFWSHIQGNNGKLVALQSVNNQISGYDIYDQSLLHQGKQTILEDKFTLALNAPLHSNADKSFFFYLIHSSTALYAQTRPFRNSHGF